jgi:translation initiation factor 2D
LIFNLKLRLILQVTLINNLELYGINIQEFARECQHGVAASTSISPVPGKKSLQLLIQGNQVLFVGNLLMGMLKVERNDC